MNLLVLGNFCWDCYGSVETEISMEPGGILYSLYALSSVMKKGDRIFPIFPINEKIADEFKSAQQIMLPQVDISGIYSTSKLNTRILVIPPKDNSAEFKALNVLEDPLSFSFFPEEQIDAVYLNFQTGYEIELNKLSELRRKYPSAFIHVDVHLLAKRIAIRNKENPEKAFQELKLVFDISDSVQFNQQELLSLIFATGKTEKEIVKAAITEGKVKAFIITKAERGVVCYEKLLNKIDTHVLRPSTVHNGNPAIGSGDILGSVFTYEVLESKGFRSSLIRGMRLAELAASKSGFKAKAEHVRINGALI